VHRIEGDARSELDMAAVRCASSLHIDHDTNF
jgi:hypothetical protein